MKMIIYQVDSFTQQPFKGNPAGVCVVPEFPAETLMQNIAAEMNVAETAFIVAGSGGGFQLRWFTPVAEVDLCGHATLASAHILWETGRVPGSDSIVFSTKSGDLTVSLLPDGMMEMDFPSEPASVIAPPDGLMKALGMPHAVYIGANRMDVLVEVSHESEVLDLNPNLSLLGEIETRGVIVTARSGGDVDFISRFFAPRFGVPEDPVTGSAHCCLAPHWSPRLGKNDLTGYQASRRGGVVRMTVRADRVILGGYAVTVMKAEMTV